MSKRVADARREGEAATNKTYANCVHQQAL